MVAEDNLENMLANNGVPVPNVWVELEGEFLEFDKENETLKCKRSEERRVGKECER